MKHNYSVAIIVALGMFSLMGCVTDQSRDGSNAQTIVGHQVVEELHKGRSVVEFSTTKRVFGGKLWAVVPNEVIRGELETVSFHWHGDDDNRRYEDDPAYLASTGWRVEQGNPVIVPYRPHSWHYNHKFTTRSSGEMPTQVAIVKYIHDTFNVKEVCLGGHSGGGNVAMYVAKESPRLMPSLKVRAVRGSSSALATREWYRKQFGYRPETHPWVLRHYNPIDDIGKMPNVPIIFVYDFDDDKMGPFGIVPYEQAAAEMGLDFNLVEVNVLNPHQTEWALGQELRKSKNERYRCF